jgi:hypothetical protein
VAFLFLTPEFGLETLGLELAAVVLHLFLDPLYHHMCPFLLAFKFYVYFFNTFKKMLLLQW